MPYDINPNLEYFLGITFPRKEMVFLAELRMLLERKTTISAPPHVTLFPPFLYHFEKPLLEQFPKWAKRQKTFQTTFKKIGTFTHHNYMTLFLAPDRARQIRELQQDLAASIRFLPEQSNYVPHLTLANRIDPENIEELKQQLRAFNLDLEVMINNVTLFEHERSQPWKVKDIYYFPE